MLGEPGPRTARLGEASGEVNDENFRRVEATGEMVQQHFSRLQLLGVTKHLHRDGCKPERSGAAKRFVHELIGPLRIGISPERWVSRPSWRTTMRSA